jgi:hypothetical protein
MKSRVGEETPLTDVQQEEDKMKMLLGAKVLVSTYSSKGKEMMIGAKVLESTSICSCKRNENVGRCQKRF